MANPTHVPIPRSTSCAPNSAVQREVTPLILAFWITPPLPGSVSRTCWCSKIPNSYEVLYVTLMIQVLKNHLGVSHIVLSRVANVWDSDGLNSKLYFTNAKGEERFLQHWLQKEGGSYSKLCETKVKMGSKPWPQHLQTRITHTAEACVITGGKLAIPCLQ
jgi:hypothetical protein